MTTHPKSTCCEEEGCVREKGHSGFHYNPQQDESSETQSTELEKIVEEFVNSFQPFWELPITNGNEATTMIEADRREKLALYEQDRLVRWLRKTLPSYAQTKVDEALREERERVLKLAGGEPYIYVPKLYEKEEN